MKPLDIFTADLVRNMLSYASDETIARHAGITVKQVRRVRAWQPGNSRTGRRIATNANKPMLDSEHHDRMSRKKAVAGSRQLLTRQLETGCHYLPADRAAALLAEIGA